MKDPVQTIERMKTFSSRIHYGYYQLNFVLQQGYFMFIADLLNEAKNLVAACEIQLSKSERWDGEKFV